MKYKLLLPFFYIALLTSSAFAEDTPSVAFSSPKNGAHVTSPVSFVMTVHGMTVHPAGEVIEGTGHHHILIDHGCVPAGTVIGADPGMHHFGKGQTEAEIPLEPGTHTATLQFANGAHVSYGPEMCQTITLHVE